MIDLDEIIRRPVLDDATLGEFRGWLLHWDGHQFLKDRIRDFKGWSSVRIEVHFIRLPDREELPDALTMGEFRKLSAAKRACIEISIGDGGQKVGEPDLVLT